MRISVEVSGHLDWEPAPPGTEITEADVTAGRVKQLSDGKYHLRIERRGDTHHDFGIHEEQVCARVAALVRLGKPKTREEVVAELARSSMAHHLYARHARKLDVLDDGPNEDAMKAALAAHPEIPAATAAAVLAEYLEPCDMTAYLSAVLLKPAKKEAK